LSKSSSSRHWVNEERPGEGTRRIKEREGQVTSTFAVETNEAKEEETSRGGGKKKKEGATKWTGMVSPIGSIQGTQKA